jgi:hypothetical protein
VEIPDDDAPPPGWGQWENWPAPVPEPAAGILVMREDGLKDRYGEPERGGVNGSR